ncbi:hypothetical protein C7B76_23535 [filamentous cyanobacterium CCP2]|nr:hypothetical protein C7B76_23535 [filamentous cyanobacterium CCP2]
MVRLNGRVNRFVLDEVATQQLQREAAKIVLEIGTYLIRIKEIKFEPGVEQEPLVLLWISGGRLINRKTGVETSSTWSLLTGYDDVLVLEVKEATLLCAFFFKADSASTGEIVLSAVQVPGSA